VTTIEVTTQAALDDALKTATKRDMIAIRGSGRFDVSDSATVTASAMVTAYDSATVTAYGSATVTAYGSATVWAYDSATVTAYDSATVRASGSATVRASGSATVRASDSATVRASGSATVWAGKYVVVHHRAEDTRVRITGGHVIEVPELDTAAAWCDYHDVAVTDGIATLYKAVDDDYATSGSRGLFAYRPGTDLEAPDWQPTPRCYNGLHACARPIDAIAYNPDATRYVAVTALLSEIVVIDETKVKAPRLTVVGEVTIDGDPIPAPKAKRVAS
jgi:hypothetical protein